MHQPDPSSPPGAHRGAKRRGLFSGRSEPAPSVSSPAAERVEVVMSAYQQMLQEQLEEGLRSIQHTANTLMHEIASEVWRASGGDKGELSSQILETLSRDQALRSLIAHTDERFQALAVRSSRLEDTMNMLAGSVRSATQHIEESVERLEGLDSHPVVDSSQIRAQLDEVTRQIAVAFGTLAERDRAIVESVRDRVLSELAEYAEHLLERIGLEARDQDRPELDDRIARVVQGNTRGLAQLVRSDSEALRKELVRTAAERDETTARILDERLARVTSALTEAIHLKVEEVARRTSDSAQEHLEQMAQTISAQGEQMARAISEQSAQALEVSIARGVVVEARMQTAVESMERTTAGLVKDHESEQAVAGTIDARIGSLAKLIRADNEALAQHIVADQDATKQALRAMKELQASLPGQVIDMVERRFASLAESIERSNEMLAKRIDKMADKIGERYDTDIQIVIDRMGDAMHALASLGRGAPGQAPGPRIELD